MPVAEPLNIPLRGAAFEPKDKAWAKASPARRLDYWKHLGEFALDVKRREIRRGIGADGKKFKPVKPESRPDGAKGPPLIPHYAESRTAYLLASHVTATGVTLFWRGHGRKSWARILGYHAYKHGPRALPVRDTIGISPAGIAKIVRNARDWWDLTSKPKKGAMPKPTPPPPPPKPVPPPPPPPKPAPAPKSTDKVIYLKKGEKPNPRSDKIQVFETRGRKPKGPPKPPPKPKPVPPPPPPPKPVPVVKPVVPPKPPAPAPKPKPVPPPPPKPTPPPPPVPKPVPVVPPKPVAPPTPKPPTPASFADQMKPRVDAEIRRLVGEFTVAKKKHEVAEARWKAVKQSTTVKPGEWEQAKAAEKEAFYELAAIVNRGKRFEAWRKDVKTNPGLIPPFDPAERLKIYAARGGDEKLKRLQALGGGGIDPRAKVAQLEAVRDQLRQKYESLPRNSPERDQVGKELARVNDERRAILNSNGIAAVPTEKVVAAIKPGKTLVVDADLVDYKVKSVGIDPVSPALVPKIDDGLGYLRQVCSQAGLPPLKVRVGMIAKGSLDRSFCNGNGIALDADVKTRVFVHEMGHHLDNTVGPGAAVDFLNYRVGNEPLRALKEVFPGLPYGPEEMGRKDRFDDAFGEEAWYVGKDYGTAASEITAMGFEKLFADPVGFAKKDPEYCSFILGMLDGSLR